MLEVNGTGIEMITKISQFKNTDVIRIAKSRRIDGDPAALDRITALINYRDVRCIGTTAGLPGWRGE